ncbi:MAG: single-stranded DNA-binding protein [Terrimesophilobacter sp.]
MTDTMTITGLVATTPRHIITAEGLAVTSFRLASNLRRFDRKRNEWVDAGTNWYTVSSYRQLALNVVASVHKGDRVLVTGRLRIREWGDGDKKGLNIDLDADALGHDLSWGKSTFARSIHSTDVEEFSAAESPAAESPAAENTDAATAERTEFATAEPLVAERELDPVTPF